MGLKFGDVSPLGGLISGQGMFGRMGRGLGIKYATDKDGNPIADESTVAAAAAAKEKEKEKGKAPTTMAKGGAIATAVHKHERSLHKGKPLTKLAKGGSTASKRADGCATKGKTRGKFV